MEITLQPGSLRNDGFGVTHRLIKKSLERVGIPIVPDGNVNFNFTHPHYGRYSDSKYDILYFPWESTGMLDGWKKHLDGFDEIWVTSPWLRNVVKEWGYESFVYEHGIDPIWVPDAQKQPSNNRFRFLMLGFEAFRKGGLEAIQGFREAFRGNPDVELVIKTNSTGLGNVFDNVIFESGDKKFPEFVELVKSADVILAPTWGEGFGLPTRDAMGAGIPAITTAGFLPYEDYVHNDLLIPSKLVDSPWPDVHPGQVFKPHVDSLVDILRNCYDNYDRYLAWQRHEAKYIHQNYQWDDLTQEAFFALESRL